MTNTPNTPAPSRFATFAEKAAPAEPAIAHKTLAREDAAAGVVTPCIVILGPSATKAGHGELRSNGKPTDDVLDILRSSGLRYHGATNSWYGPATLAAQVAEQIAGAIGDDHVTVAETAEQARQLWAATPMRTMERGTPKAKAGKAAPKAAKGSSIDDAMASLKRMLGDGLPPKIAAEAVHALGCFSADALPRLIAVAEALAPR